MPWAHASTSLPSIKTESPRLKNLAKLASLVLSEAEPGIRQTLATRLNIDEAEVFVELAREYLRLTN